MDASVQALDDIQGTEITDTMITNETLAVSLHAMTGTTSPTIMRVSVFLKNHQLSVLLDSSFHS